MLTIAILRLTGDSTSPIMIQSSFASGISFGLSLKRLCVHEGRRDYRN